jgi:hypothetical protein
MNRIYHFSNPNERSILLSSDKLSQYIKNEFGSVDPSYIDYNIVATLGVPVSGKSKCISMILSHKLANRNQPHSSTIYLVPTLFAVMSVTAWIGHGASQHGQLNNVVYMTNTFIGVWISKSPYADILVIDCEEVTMQEKQAWEASIFVLYSIMIQLIWSSVNTDRNDDQTSRKNSRCDYYQCDRTRYLFI